MSVRFRTTNDQIIRLAEIVTAMAKAGVDRRFIVECDRVARVDQGTYELMELWFESELQEDKDEALADLVDVVQDWSQRRPELKPYIPFDGLDEIGGNILEHKKRLRALIDKHGGVTQVARRTGIPQPSLSRMLNNASMPRRATLYRIATALNVPEADVIGEWVW